MQTYFKSFSHPVLTKGLKDMEKLSEAQKVALEELINETSFPSVLDYLAKIANNRAGQCEVMADDVEGEEKEDLLSEKGWFKTLRGRLMTARNFMLTRIG